MQNTTLENIFAKIFHYFALVLFLVLFINGMFGTGKEQAIGKPSEFVLWQQDSFFLNAAKVLAGVLVLILVNQIYDRFVSKWNANILLAACCLISGLFSLYWVTTVSCYPVADQFTVCYYASLFNQGDFTDLQEISYLTGYPQQLGIITFLRIIFKLFGDMNYRAFQYMCALLIPVLVLAGCMIVRHLTDRNHKAEFYYLLLTVCCVPMYLYVPFIYGELPSTVLGLCSIWILLSCFKKFSILKLIGLCLTSGLMVQLRKNTLIFVIAMFIVVLVRIITKFKWQTLVTGMSILAGVLLLQGAVNLTYAGVRDTSLKGIPASLHLVMGLNGENGNPGWYNAYVLTAFSESGYDPKIANERAYRDLKVALEEFKENPKYMLEFYTKKMNFQWNTPMYQGRVMNNHFNKELRPLAVSVYGGAKMDILLQGYAKIYQLLMYGSILFMLFAEAKGKKGIEEYILLIDVFGGFLFSMMWETKTRYVFPYLLMLLPVYGMAIEKFLTRFLSGAKKILRSK